MLQYFSGMSKFCKEILYTGKTHADSQCYKISVDKYYDCRFTINISVHHQQGQPSTYTHTLLIMVSISQLLIAIKLSLQSTFSPSSALTLSTGGLL